MPASSSRFLAVTVLLLAMAYVTLDTQRDVDKANDHASAADKKANAAVKDRTQLKLQIANLQTQVNQLKAANTRLGEENKRLTALLIAKGIDPRPSPTPSHTPQVSSASSPSPTPKATPARSRSPTPSPSPTCKVRNPVNGKCLIQIGTS